MDPKQLYQELRAKLGDVVPDVELRQKAAVAAEVLRLKTERNALILGHNYMEPALFHSVPDHTGDSLELSRIAATTDRDIIVFCGVRFMAETAKILNPSKRVLLPSQEAGCSLAGGITAADVRKLRERYPGAPVVVYVNTYADVKAEADVCCTSSNAVAVVESLGAEVVIFLPDEYLAANVARETGRQLILPPRNGDALAAGSGTRGALIGWRGRCEVHERFTVADIRQAREQFPDVVVLAHPECSPEVVAEADYAGSTTAMAKYVERGGPRRYLMLTECAMADNVLAANPGTEMLRMCAVRCPHMNQITLEATRDALLLDRYPIEVPDDVQARAAASVERMLTIRPQSQD
jgi:quinolinate synthase